MAKLTNRDLHAIDAAQAITQSGAPELLRSEEAKVVSELVSAYNGGKLTDRDAAIGIAVIARIRRIFNNLQRTLTEGIDAGHKLRG